MHNRVLVLDILEQIYDATQKVLKRFEPIKTANELRIKKIMKDVQEEQN